MESTLHIEKCIDYDVIFIGQLGLVVANLLFQRTKDKYKCLIINNSQKLIQPALLPTHDHIFRISKNSIKEYHYAASEVTRIVPGQKVIKTKNRMVYRFKLLVYGKSIQHWINYDCIENLEEALQTHYSRVYSNIENPLKISEIDFKDDMNTEKIVFYIPKPPHHGFDNYAFLYQYEQVLEKKSNNHDSILIILEGKQFYPYCEIADHFLKESLLDHSIQIIFDTKIVKIDYLRRVLYAETSRTYLYDYFFCYNPLKAPQILKKACINPFYSDKQTLCNRHFEDIFIFGADVFPTTHSFKAINHQAHVISINLEHFLENSNEYASYDGKTEFPVWLGKSKFVNFKHKYKEVGKEKGCECFSNIRRNFIFNYQVSMFYNLKLYGAPYYLFSPDIQTTILKTRRKSNFRSKKQILQDIKKLNLNFRKRGARRSTQIEIQIEEESQCS